MHPDIESYHEAQGPEDRRICEALAALIDKHLPEAESKVWHRHPVWFIEGNPIVGYSPLQGGVDGGKEGGCVRLLFWSGQSFDEPELLPAPPGGKFKSAEVRYTKASQVKAASLKRWLKKSAAIQWDYKDIVKRKGKLIRLK